MKRILPVILVVVVGIGGSVAASVPLSAPYHQKAAGASVLRDAVSASRSSSLADQPASASSQQAASEHTSTSGAQPGSNTSQPRAQGSAEVARTPEPSVAAPTGVVCPDGTTRPKCLTVVPPQPLPVPCTQEAGCNRPISGRPRLPICPHSTSPQGSCSPMTN